MSASGEERSGDGRPEVAGSAGRGGDGRAESAGSSRGRGRGRGFRSWKGNRLRIYELSSEEDGEGEVEVAIHKGLMRADADWFEKVRREEQERALGVTVVEKDQGKAPTEGEQGQEKPAEGTGKEQDDSLEVIDLEKMERPMEGNGKERGESGSIRDKEKPRAGRPEVKARKYLAVRKGADKRSEEVVVEQEIDRAEVSGGEMDVDLGGEETETGGEPDRSEGIGDANKIGGEPDRYEGIKSGATEGIEIQRGSGIGKRGSKRGSVEMLGNEQNIEESTGTEGGTEMGLYEKAKKKLEEITENAPLSGGDEIRGAAKKVKRYLRKLTYELEEKEVRIGELVAKLKKKKRQLREIRGRMGMDRADQSEGLEDCLEVTLEEMGLLSDRETKDRETVEERESSDEDTTVWKRAGKPEGSVLRDWERRNKGRKRKGLTVQTVEESVKRRKERKVREEQ